MGAHGLQSNIRLLPTSRMSYLLRLTRSLRYLIGWSNIRHLSSKARVHCGILSHRVPRNRGRIRQQHNRPHHHTRLSRNRCGNDDPLCDLNAHSGIPGSKIARNSSYIVIHISFPYLIDFAKSHTASLLPEPLVFVWVSSSGESSSSWHRGAGSYGSFP